jgi:hypothetical protein
MYIIYMYIYTYVVGIRMYYIHPVAILITVRVWPGPAVVILCDVFTYTCGSANACDPAGLFMYTPSGPFVQHRG